MLSNTSDKLKQVGIMAIPCSVDKSPVVKKWRSGAIEYTPLQWEKAGTLGIRCGNGIEVIDFDIKYGETFTLWQKLVSDFYPDLLPKLYIEQTPSGGHHVIYKSEIVEGNLKLAKWVQDGKEVCPIETRGEGGYCIVAPSPKYKTIQGSLLSLPLITSQEREGIIQICKSFNKVAPKPHKQYVPKDYNGDDAIESFNSKFDIIELLIKHGWTKVRESADVYYMLREGGTTAHSATFNYMDRRILYVFSGNALPFEAERGYSVFAAYALLEHRGDYKAAFKTIKMLGYGTTPVLSPIAGEVTRIENTQEIRKLEAMAFEALQGGVELSSINFEMVEQATGSLHARGVFERVYAEKSDFFGFSKKTTQAKAEIMIKSKFDLQKNIVTGGLYTNSNGKIEKINPTEIWGEVGRVIEVRKDVVRSLCELKGVAKEYDPFYEYFESLTWDGQDEIAKFGSFIKVEEQEFHDAQLEKMFVRSIHCMLGRGENRFVWTYVGGQYIGKSYLIRFFCPPSLKEYYTEEKPTSDKDCAIRMQENGFYNWEELQSSTNFEINQMKALISKYVNKVRRPYGTQEDTYPRRANFFASTNEAIFLTDDENTRWLPFTILDIDQAYSRDVNIDNCWAQAYHKYKAGFNYNVTKAELQSQKGVNENYRFMTSEEELILKYFDKIPFEAAHRGVYLSSVEIMNKINTVTAKGIRITKERVGRIMNHKGYYKMRDKNGIFVYLVIDSTSEAFGEVRNPYADKPAPHDWKETKIKEDDLPF